MSKWPAGLVLALTAAQSALAGSSAEDLVARVVARGAASGITSESLAPAIAAIESAASRGLPAEDVADKVLEGLAKGAPPAKVAAAAADLAQRLGDAQDILARAGAAPVGPVGIEARLALGRVASALLVLRDKGPLSRLADAAHGVASATFVAAARELGDLVGRGVAAPDAERAMAALAKAGYGPADIDRVSSLLDEYRAEGGEELSPFFDELGRRAASRASLEGIVNPFGDRGAPVTGSEVRGEASGLDARPGEKGARGQTALEEILGGRSGANPSVDAANRKRKRGSGP